jgi:predicted DNA binding CopG/RHH family protein
MKKIDPRTMKLTAEEQAWHDAVDWDSARPITPKEQERLKQIARNTTAKNKIVTFRVSERDHMRLKAAAAREGVPYQTLISSLIHKHI